jgi:hypothetical protein
MWNILFYSWAKPLYCYVYSQYIITSVGIVSNLDNNTAYAECQLGVFMITEQFFYMGRINNRPYDLTWSGTDERII